MSRRLPEAVAAALRDREVRLIITGAGGWIGQATLELLADALGEAFERRVVAFGSSERSLSLRGGRSVLQRPLTTLTQLEPAPSFVFHTAFLTKDKVAGMSGEDYVAANRDISDRLFGALGAIGATGLFLASSGAAAFADDPKSAPDLRLYGRLKLEDEDRAERWAATSGGSAVIARIFSLTGPYINKPDSYALASFLLDALGGRPVEVRATRRVVRSYASIRDLLALSLAMLLGGRPGTERFDTGGEPMEMGEIARAVDAAFGGAGVIRPPMAEGNDNIYTGDDRQWRNLLAGQGIDETSFADQLRETADYLACPDRLRPAAGSEPVRQLTQVDHA